MVNIDDKRLQQAFLEEVTELLDTLNKQLLALEDNPADKSVINEIFRMTHSIKSESALIGYKNISTIAHKMEDIFEKVRRGVLLVDRPIMDSLFGAFDRIMQLIHMVQEDKDESQIDISDVINPLLIILNEKKEENKTDNTKQKIEDASLGLINNKNTQSKQNTEINLNEIELTDMQKIELEEALEKGFNLFKISFKLSDECEMRYPRAYLVYNNFMNRGSVLLTIPDIMMEADDEKFKEITIYFMTEKTTEEFRECGEVDQVEKLDILKIDKRTIKAKLGHVVSILDEMSPEEIENAEMIEKEWETKTGIKHKENPVTKTDNKNIENHDDGNTKDTGSKTVESSKSNTKETVNDDKSSISQTTTAGKELQKQTIRVDIDRLDILMNLVGELIINRSRFTQIREKITDQTPIQEIKTEMEDATNELERITDQMQSGMMQARMVPIGNVFSKFPRMVRDLANNLHKNVNLSIVGENTEIDRTVIELIADPLTHLLRNCIDHGFESPQEREGLGKSREGKLLLRAYQEGSSIYIEVSDDGRGINLEAVKEKSLEKGLYTAQQLNSMSHNEILNIIFEPGFSTKSEVTNLSGRGVGMDVVKTQIEKLRGRVDINTANGRGTKFTIILPLTLTIVEALLVNVQRNIFAIPISVVEETIKVKREEIKQIDDYQVYNLRSETLAVIYLSDLVGLPKEIFRDDVFIVVVAFEKRKIGLIVNNLIGEQDIVIKALDESLRTNKGIAGASVLGDGKVALILDTSTLVKVAIREINKLSDTYNFYKENNIMVNINNIYDELNKENPEINEILSRSDGEPEIINIDENLSKINQALNDLKNNK